MTVRLNTKQDLHDVKSERAEEQVLPDLILSYLVHHGYARTAETFLTHISSSSGVNKARHSGFESIKHRNHLSQVIRDGGIIEAIDVIQKHFPRLAGKPSGVPKVSFYHLLCQNFVELIRKGEANDALSFAEHTLAPLAGKHPELSPGLQNVICLLAYADPKQSAVAHLLSEEIRISLAEQINADILGEVEPKLDTLLKQACAVTDLAIQLDPNTK